MPSMKPEGVEPLVTTDRELVRNGFPFIGELAAPGAYEQVLLLQHLGGGRLRLLFFLLDNGSGRGYYRTWR